ncbi:MAG TPA: AtpZ/AtpI family protein [Xanthobacteraceae bacterium]|jgi:ATP synthase protein I|nr:AtpZ/AtpI family protein [Xanthobacteraceae bacterium]
MTNGARNNDDPGSQPNDEAALSARLQRLGQRLDHMDTGRLPERSSAPRSTADTSAFARGFRLSSELVGGVVVGAVLGWLFDHWLGTSPWGLIVLVLLGFVAGVINVIRTAGVSPGQYPGNGPRSLGDE